MNEEKKEIERLKQLLKNQEVSAKMLVRRDLELNRAYEKVKELGQLKADFVSVVAHQLRTPLSITKWALDMLAEINTKSLTSEQVQVLVRAKDSNDRMISLVDDLIKVDLHDGGKVQYVFKSLSLGDVVDHVVGQLQIVAQRRSITLTVSASEVSTRVYGDEGKLKSVLQNLIENSLKYTPKGGSVSVSVKVKNAMVEVSIKDTGIGIPKSEEDKLFSRFYRGENAIKTITDGSGLGLFIAKKIVKRHSGEIWFESEEGKGTTFYFTIPIENSSK